jgi:hypothetical protein
LFLFTLLNNCCRIVDEASDFLGLGAIAQAFSHNQSRAIGWHYNQGFHLRSCSIGCQGRSGIPIRGTAGKLIPCSRKMDKAAENPLDLKLPVGFCSSRLSQIRDKCSSFSKDGMRISGLPPSPRITIESVEMTGQKLLIFPHSGWSIRKYGLAQMTRS